VRSSSFRVDSRVLGRVLAAVLALTLTTAALAGCGSVEKPKADPSPTSKPSVPPGLDTTPPSKPKAAETKESAAEYGAYFAQLVQYAIRTRNVRPVMAEALDQAKCSTCRELSEFIEQKLRANKYWDTSPDIRLGKFSARPQGDGFAVQGAFRYPPGQVVTVDGAKKEDVSGAAYRFEADVVWDPDGSRWRVLDYTFLNKSED